MEEEENRFLKYRKSDITIIRSLQESVMNEAAYGMLFRMGQLMGSRIAKAARPFKQQYFEAARRLLVDEGWAKDIQFQNDVITVSGSIEVEKGRDSTCHMLRGVIAKIYEGYFGKIMYCAEQECDSGEAGKGRCLFKVQYANPADKAKKA